MLPDRPAQQAEFSSARQNLVVEPDEAPRTAGGQSYWALSTRRLLRKKLAMICLSVILVLYGSAMLSPLVTPYSYTTQDLLNSKQGPTWAHPFGTDRLGRDMMTRVIYGLRTTVIVTITSLLGGTLVLGIVLGLLSGYMGRWVDSVIMRTGEVTSSFPDIFLILIFVATIKPRMVVAVRAFEDATGIDWIIRLGVLDFAIIAVALSVFSWFGMARLVRGQVLSLRETEFVTAARTVGATDWRIMRVHIFPHVVGPVVVSMTLGTAGAILAEAGLSYLGLGVQAPVPSWGGMVSRAANFTALAIFPWQWLPPGIAITLAVLAINFLGDGLRDALDVRSKHRGI
jgi:peptide/nickel transport system permease protein